MKITVLIAILLISDLAYGQFIQVDKLVNYPEEIHKLISSPITAVYQVDFNGDGADDFIVESNDNRGTFKEFWISSNYNLELTNTFSEEINFRFLLNLDNDSELEIFRATGYEDGIDYSFNDLNLADNEENLIFYINPVISSNGINYWGYPWDIEDIWMDGTKIWSSINHNIIRDGEVILPEEQKILPVIIFKGNSTQPDSKVTEINSTDWLTVEELKIHVYE